MGESLLDPVQAMLEVIKHHNRLSVGRLDHILQGIQLGIVDQLYALFLVIHSTTGHLQQLIRQDCGRLRYHISVKEWQKQLLLQFLVLLPGFLAQRDLNRSIDPFRQLQPVLGFHTDGDI
ncbi:hypothetical protein PALA111701_32075 [Paenibacillus lactis]